MTIQLIDLKPIWSRQFHKTVYSCIIANLIGDPEPEVIGCSFSAEMKAFNLKGNEVFLTEFPSNITCFKVASVSKEKSIELISGAIDGFIYVMDNKGDSIWSKKFDSPIICMETGDLKDDSREEIVVGLENQRLIGLDNDGSTFLNFEAKEQILDCTIGHFSESYVGKIFVLLKSGKIYNINNDANSELVFQLENQITSLTVCSFNNQPIMVVGDKEGIIRIFNINQEIIGLYKIGGKIRCLDNFTVSKDQEKCVLLVAASNEIITLFELKKGKKKEIIETPVETISQEQIYQIPITERAIRHSSSVQDNSDIEKAHVSPQEDEKKQPSVRVLRGGQIQGGEYVFKVKVVNKRKYNITDVNIHIISYPEESLLLSRVDGHPESSPDRVKIRKISKGGGFVSPSFIFKPTKDCIKGTIHAVINFINEQDQIETINVEPHEIRMICGLLKPKVVSNDDFETFTKDLLTLKKVGEDFTVPYKADQLYQKLIVLLKHKNFAIIDTEKEYSEDKFQAIIKGFAEGSFSKDSVGLELTITGKKDEKKSVLNVNIFAEDVDMSPHIMSEFENAVSPQCCPECQGNLPPELVKKLMAGIHVYCEVCGSDLLELSEDEH